MLLALAALLVAGCGSSHSGGTDADPASAVPATAPLYVGVTLRPTGSEQSEALAAGKALTGQADPYERLLGALRTPGSPPLDYKRDVAPWLGPHAGLFARSLGSAGALLAPLTASLSSSGQIAALPFSASGLDGALVMDTRDTGAARTFLAGQAKHAGAHSSSYRGVSYEVSPGGVAFGLVGSFAVVGSEAGLRAVIGATQGEAALSTSSGYSKLAAGAPSEAIAHLYVSPGAAARPLASASAHSILEALGGARQTFVSVTAQSTSLALDIDTLAAPGSERTGLLSADPQAAQALSELPGESWLAIGIGHAGSTLAGTTAVLSALGSLAGSEQGGAAISVGSLLGGLTQPLHVLAARTAAARRDYTSWMGSAGIFAAGSSVFELHAAVTIASTDAARSRAAVAKLAAAMRAAGDEVAKVKLAGTEAAASVRLPGVPLPVYLAAGQSSNGPKFVLALGEASVAAALSPSSTLAGSPARSAGASALGEGIQPSVLVDVPTLLALLEGVGLGEDPSLAPLLPYLRASGTLAGGGHQLEGEVERFRVLLRLRSAGG